MPANKADWLRYVIEDQPWIENIHLISVLRTFYKRTSEAIPGANPFQIKSLNDLASVTATRDELVRRLQQGEMISLMMNSLLC